MNYEIREFTGLTFRLPSYLLRHLLQRGWLPPPRFIVRFKILYRVMQPLIQHCLLSKMVYLNLKYVIATRSYDFFYIYAKSHWKYHTFEGYYICSFSKLRHKVHQNVRKCSLTFPLQNGIVTF